MKTSTTVMRWRKLAALSAVLSSLYVPSAQAVDIDAGDYTALPPGTNLAIAYYQYATRDALYTHGNKQAINAGLDSQVGILRGVHFTEIAGITIDPQFLLPFGRLEGKDDLSSLGSTSGVGDLMLATTAWLVNNPQAGTYFGITPLLYLPTGSYDKSKALNLGENRWKFALQGGYITKLSQDISLDLAADFMIFGDNNDYGAAGATLKQKTQYQLQGFLRYQLTPSLDLRTGLSQVTGGETKLNGVDQGDRQRTTKMLLGAAWFATPSVQLMFNYGQDLSVENGLKEANRFNFRLLKAF